MWHHSKYFTEVKTDYIDHISGLRKSVPLSKRAIRLIWCDISLASPPCIFLPFSICLHVFNCSLFQVRPAAPLCCGVTLPDQDFSFSQAQETRPLSPQHWVPPLTSQLLMSLANEQEMRRCSHLGMRCSPRLQCIIFFEGASTTEDHLQVLSSLLSPSLGCPCSQHCCSEFIWYWALPSLPLISSETWLQSQLRSSLLVCSIFIWLTPPFHFLCKVSLSLTPGRSPFIPVLADPRDGACFPN